MRPRFSVVIVSWNARAFLLECLASVYAQNVDGGSEIIVVDNASSDGSPEAVAVGYPGVRLIRQTANVGFARGTNTGIRISTGDYLLLINSDVVVEPGCIRHLLAYMDANPRIGILGPRIRAAGGQVQRSCMAAPTLWNTLTRALALDITFPKSPLFGGQLLTFWDHSDTRDVEVINGCFWAVRREALDDVGLLDERFLIYGEDLDWCKRFRERGWRVVFCSGASVLHYGGASSSNAPLKFYLEMQRSNYQYWQKHHSRPVAAAYLSINTLHHLVRLVGGLAMYSGRTADRTRALRAVSRSIASLKLGAAFFGAFFPFRRSSVTASRTL